MKNYVEMTTEELRDILREDVKKSSRDAMTYEELKPILEILASRDGITRAQTEKAWGEFVKYYLPSSF